MDGSNAFIVATCFIASLCPSLLYGGSGSARSGQALEQPLINITAGQAGIDRKLNNPWIYGIEYRFSPQTRYRLVPSIGVAAGTDHANFIYAELRRDFRLSEHWLLTPSFGFGRFNNRRRFYLGQLLEFRSGLEISRHFNQGYRLGVAIFHLSNGGLSDENPGTETAALSFSIPLDPR